MKKLRNFNFTKSLIWLYVKIFILKFSCCPVQALTVQKNRLRLVKSLVHSLHSFHIVYLSHICTKAPIWLYRKNLHLVPYSTFKRSQKSVQHFVVKQKRDQSSYALFTQQQQCAAILLETFLEVLAKCYVRN